MDLFKSMSQGLLGGLGSGIISGGLGAIGSIFSNNSQKKENQRNREFTEYMYDRQYDNNIKLWNMQNKYDLPSAQKQRLLDAGLNADLMYSGKGVSPSPNLQAAVAGSPSSGSLPGYGGVAEAFNQGRLLDAQIRNIDADTKKKESETEGQGYQNEILKTDASFEAAIKSGQVNVLGVQVDFSNSQIEVNKATVPKLRQEVINLQKSVEVMNSNIDEASERIANLSQMRVGIMLDNYIKDQSKESQIRQFAAAADLSEKEAKMYVARAISEIARNNASARLDNANASNAELDFKIGSLDFKLKNEKGYYNMVIDNEIDNFKTSSANNRRIRERDDKISGDHWYSYVLEPLDIFCNLVGGIFSANTSYSGGSKAPNVRNTTIVNKIAK